MNIVQAVIDLKEKHKETWREKPESYWLARLMQEVGELGSSLVGDHDDPAEWELMQISAICLNWLEMRNPQVLPTKHAPDVVESAASVSISTASEVSASEADSTPATTQVM